MVPNELLDKDMKDMGKAEMKIVLATCRKTFGWQKERDRISYTQFELLTGLSRSSVVDGINAGISRGILRKHKTKAGNEYSLNIDPFPDPIPTKGTQAVPVEGHTKESILKKTTATQDFLTASITGKTKPFHGYPADVSQLLQVFSEEYPRIKVDNKGKWIKQARVWVGMGIVEKDIKAMCKYVKSQDGWMVAQPASITSAYNIIQNQPKPEDPVKRF